MDIKSPKDLEKLAITCRKQGIAEIKVTSDSVEFKLWDHVPACKTSRKPKETQEEFIPIEGAPTEEEILMWSAGLPAASLQEN